MHSPPFLAVLWFFGLLGAVALTAVGVSFDLRFGNGSDEPIPASVRENPASWRPVYVGASGWSAPSSGGGGFSMGK